MHLKKILRHRFFLLGVLVFVFALTRLPSLGPDVINPDGVNWHYRSEQFWVGLKTGQLEKTYQHYHPGVTLMWVSGAGIEMIKQVFPDEAVYDHINFLTYHFVAKYFLISFQLILSVIIFFLLYRTFKINDVRKPTLLSFFVILLLTLEPFFVGNSRLLHLDVLVTLLLFIGLLFSYLSTKDYKTYYVIGAGVFLSLSFLTKSVAIGGVLFAAFMGGLILFADNKRKKIITYEILLIGAFLVTTFLLFPALWEDPLGVFMSIFQEAERVGGRKGHGQIVFGEYTRDPGVSFYFLVLIIKTSLFTLVGALTFLLLRFNSYLKNSGKKKIKISFTAKSNLQKVLERIKNSPIIYLGIFYLGYLVVMIIPSKKIDRYMLVLFPYLVLLAVFGYFMLYQKIKEKFRPLYVVLLGLAFSLFVLLPLITFYPYYFTYSSPVVGSAENAHNIVAQKPFGVGVYELRQFIFDKYGQFPDLGFIDTKPMGAIYMNSRIFDVRENGPSEYELLILAVNEEIPENVINKDFEWVKDSSLYINGLEYWEVYAKRYHQ